MDMSAGCLAGRFDEGIMVDFGTCYSLHNCPGGSTTKSSTIASCESGYLAMLKIYYDIEFNSGHPSLSSNRNMAITRHGSESGWHDSVRI